MHTSPPWSCVTKTECSLREAISTPEVLNTKQKQKSLGGVCVCVCVCVCVGGGGPVSSRTHHTERIAPGTARLLGATTMAVNINQRVGVGEQLPWQHSSFDSWRQKNEMREIMR